MSDADAPGGRNLDHEKPGERAKAPPSLIRKPIALPAMQRVQTDCTATAASPDELRRRAAEGDRDAIAELNRRGGGFQ